MYVKLTVDHAFVHTSIVYIVESALRESWTWSMVSKIMIKLSTHMYISSLNVHLSSLTSFKTAR